MTERINSRIFGVVLKATPMERECIQTHVDLTPVDVFQALGQLLSKRGLMLGVRPLQASDKPDPQDIMSDARIRNSGPVGEDR
jgi:hypothetical protein